MSSVDSKKNTTHSVNTVAATEHLSLDGDDPTDSQGKRLTMYIYVLPNLVTTGNLFCGFFATMQSIRGDYVKASYAIVAAALFDQLDGRLARLTRSTSKFGAEYDSLCDLVSFGMAPAIMLFQWALWPFGRLGWASCFLFVAGGALRLARFNVQHNVIEKNYFQGLPIPMAAGIVASAVLAYHHMEWEGQESYLLLGMTILLAVVMVSQIRYRSFKDLDLKERLPFRYLILGVGIIYLVALAPQVMLFVLFLGYALLGAVFGFFRWGKNVRKIKPNAYNPAHVDEPDLIFEEDDTSVVTNPVSTQAAKKDLNTGEKK